MKLLYGLTASIRRWKELPCQRIKPPPFSLEQLRCWITYYPDAGVFIWNVTRGGGCCAGTLAGCADQYGYLRIGINNIKYAVADLVWFWCHGEWPSFTIDHKNTDSTDNRICNLRPATRSQNNANRHVRRDSVSGIKGVSFHKQRKKWMARIKKDNNHIHLGLFNTPEEAKAAYDLAAIKYHGEFARL